MKKITLGLLAAVLVILVVASWWKKQPVRPMIFKEGIVSIESMKSLSESGQDDQESENSLKRVALEIMQLVDPSTGRIPDNIERKELAFAKESLNIKYDQATLSTLINGKSTANIDPEPVNDFQNVGPVNVGGRTRGLAIDVTDENIFLAGSTTGGVWRTTDQGANWTRTTAPDQHPAVTSIIQDRRSGRTNEWYYATGERFFSNASEFGSFYLGNGIYKSTDGGASWNLISTTAATGSTGTDVLIVPETFSLMDELAIDYSNPSGTEIYAGGTSKIIRSEDGFVTFSIILGENNTADNFTDVAVTTSGKVFATIGTTNFNGDQGEDGIFMSDDGITFTNINPPIGFPSNTPRIEIGIDPSDENIVYFITVDGLFKFDDSDDTWIDLTGNLPIGTDFGEGHNGQFGLDLYVSVHPSDPNVIYAGGVNLMRSTDGFTTPDNIEQIGGYRPDGNPNTFQLYDSHHPDMHEQLFFESDPDKMLTASDGGIHITEDNQANNAGTFKVSWEPLNLGYVTAQFYHGDIHQYQIGDQVLIGGMQDNGTWVKVGPAPDDLWVEIAPGDGTYSAINYNTLFASSQFGDIVKYQLNPINNTYEFVNARLSPSNDPDDFLFINPYIYNPVHQDQLFVAGLGGIFVTNDILENPEAGDWIEPIVPASLNGEHVSSLAMSTQPEGVLYFGSARGKIYKIDDTRALSASTQAIELNSDDLPTGYIVDLEVDPEDANRVIVIFSNYGVVSAWLTEDGGDNWASISGNLEENVDGTGAGPSLRAVAIMPDGDGENYYFMGTTVGLFMATSLDGDNTNWVQQGADEIGNIVIGEIATRPIEGVVAAYTRGNGVFSAKYDVNMIANINYSFTAPSRVLLRANESIDEDQPLGYQWLLDGEALTGENGPTLAARLPGIYQVRLFFSQTESVLSNAVDLNVALITSIDDDLLNDNEEIIVDANPSNGIFNLAFPNEFNGDFELFIINESGQRVMTQNVSDYSTGDQVTIDLTTSPDGLYIMRVANSNLRTSIKLLKRTK